MESVEVRCPSCGEPNEIELEWGSFGRMVQDCWVCCRPFELDVRWDEWGDPSVTVERAE